MIKYISAYLFVFLLLNVGVNTAEAEVRHALLIGIDNYLKPDSIKNADKMVRPSCRDLTGSVNNVTAMSDVLNARFGFRANDIHLLTNERATKADILSSLEELRGKCNVGDVVFFYFSGYGSQVSNSGSGEAGKMDKSIVPYDGVYKGNDIRVKELYRVFDKFSSKEVKLNIVFECSHSSSSPRGVQMMEETLPPPAEVVNDNKSFPDLQKRGALIIHAAQDKEGAYVKDYEGKMFGVFTKALLDVINRVSVNTPVFTFYKTLAARLKNEGETQVPVIACNEERGVINIAGTEYMPNELKVSADVVNPDNTVIFIGGLSLGIVPGTEFTNESNTLKIEVTGNIGLSRSSAKIMAGSYQDLKPGVVFKRTGRALAAKHKINICVPVCDFKKEELIALGDSLQKMIEKKRLKIIYDPKTPADYILYFRNSKWMLNANGTDMELGAKTVLSDLALQLQADKSIEVRFPFYKEIYDKLLTHTSGEYSCINITDMGNSDYFAAGIVLGKKFLYALKKTEPDNSPDAFYPSIGIYATTKPDDEDAGVVRICEGAYKLGKIKSWLTLESTDRSNDFPYDLNLRNDSTGEMFQGGDIQEEEQFKFYIVKNSLQSGTDSVLKRRWVYILDITGDKDIHLLYPISQMNSDNFIPKGEGDPGQEELFSSLIMLPPYGTYHLVMLSSDRPIVSPSRIEGKIAAKQQIMMNPLEEIIDDINSRRLDVKGMKDVSDWDIQKVHFNIVAKPAVEEEE